MTKRIVTSCVLVFTLLFSLNALAQKEVTRYLGESCRADAKITPRCGSGLTCKNEYCERESYLSGTTLGCKEEMKNKAGWTSYVAVHDGFCYVNDHCRSMYDAAVAASDVTGRLLSRAEVGSEAYSAELAKLSEAEKATFKRAEDTCKSCGRYCSMGPLFHDGDGSILHMESFP